MPQIRSYETDTPDADHADGTETQAPSADGFTSTPSTPGQAYSKDGEGNWGVAARWFMFAMLAIAFVVALYVLF